MTDRQWSIMHPRWQMAGSSDSILATVLSQHCQIGHEDLRNQAKEMGESESERMEVVGDQVDSRGYAANASATSPVNS